MKKYILYISLWLCCFSAASVWGQYSQGLVQAEYFWGTTDPGQGSGSSLSAADGAFDNTIEAILKQGEPAPAVGVNLLNIRFRGNNGAWGPLFKTVVSVDVPVTAETHITHGEYFVGTDAGEGANHAFTALDGNFDNVIEGALQTGIALPPVGVHILGARFKGINGNWGPLFRLVFQVDSLSLNPEINLVSAEYFFGADPGQGMGQPLLASDGNFDGSIENMFSNISTGGLTAGPQKISVRTKGRNGIWGPVFSMIVVVEPCFPSPVAIITSGGSTTICPGDNVTLTANSGAGLTYQWLKDGSIISGVTSQSFNAGAAGYYSVAVTNSGGCTTVSDSIVVTMGGTPPSVSIVSDAGTAICANDEVTFTATPVSGGATPTYQWQVNGMNVGTNSATYTTKSLTNNAVVRCILTSSEVCVFPETDTSNLITMTVSNVSNSTQAVSSCGSYTWTDGNGQTYTASTTVSYTFSNGASNGCDSIVTLNLTINDVDNTVSLSGATLTAHQTGATYQWLDCDNGNTPISGETSQSFEPTANGKYAVEVTANGCTETSSCVVVNSVGIESLGQNGWNVYPNPNSGVFTVTSIQEFNNAVIEIYSAMGQLIYKNIHSGNSIVIELAEQPTGVYILKVNNQQNFRVIKL